MPLVLLTAGAVAWAAVFVTDWGGKRGTGLGFVGAGLFIAAALIAASH